MKLRSSVSVVGFGHVRTTFVFSGFTLIPCRPTSNPRNSVSSIMKEHFLLIRKVSRISDEIIPSPDDRGGPLPFG